MNHKMGVGVWGGGVRILLHKHCDTLCLSLYMCWYSRYYSMYLIVTPWHIVLFIITEKNGRCLRLTSNKPEQRETRKTKKTCLSSGTRYIVHECCSEPHMCMYNAICMSHNTCTCTLYMCMHVV